MKIDRIIDLLKIEQKCILRNTNNECNRQCGECDLVQDDAELNEMYTNVINILEAQVNLMDSMPMSHGRWILVQNGSGVCSVCNRSSHIDKLAKYCKFCGSRMDE